MWAPFQLTIRTNTSCHTDEFVAHRIGLVPFKRVGNGDTMEIKMCGPCTVYARDVIGPAFEAVFPSIEISRLGPRQELDLTVHFDEQFASKHARYAPCAAVGMLSLGLRRSEGKRNDAQSHDRWNDESDSDDDDSTDKEECKISFEIIDGRTPVELMYSALDRLEQRVDNALVALGNQPIHPPKSMC